LGVLVANTVGLVKSFGSTVALDGLDLEIPKGISGFVGSNGAGKTTTIGILLGLLKPERGEATVFGLDCWRNSFEIRRRTGVLHENNTFPGNFSGRRFLEHVADIYGVTDGKQSAKALLKTVGLSDSKDRLLKGYSAGMTRRLGLAQALIGDPEFVILDEPTANIDPMGRIDLLNKIKELHNDSGTSFLISTHILSELEQVCDWLSIIDSGKIVDQGHINDLADKYFANIYVIEVSQPAVLLEKIKTLRNVEQAWIEDEKIYCKFRNPNEFFTEIPKIVVSLNLELKSFRKSLGTFEEIYKKTAGDHKNGK